MFLGGSNIDGSAAANPIRAALFRTRRVDHRTGQSITVGGFMLTRRWKGFTGDPSPSPPLDDSAYIMDILNDEAEQKEPGAL